MDLTLRTFLADLAELGRQNDARETERGKRLLNITPETGELLAILVRAIRARRILEIGTSNGYSTIWLAWAAQETDGQVTTLERLASKARLARANFARAGVAERITLIEGIALATMAGLDEPFDFIFLDADRPAYLPYLEAVVPRLRPGGLLVTDNVVSHAHELTDFLDRLARHPLLDTVTVPVGNGQTISYKRP
jgi:predicted O-methyltransferase YrrM